MTWSPAQAPAAPPPPPPPERELRLPSWTMPLLMSLATGLTGGAVGVGVGRTTAESPAAIVTNLEHLQASQERQERKIDTLDESISKMNTQMVEDRWRGSDHRAWIASDFHPVREDLKDLEDSVTDLATRVTTLESRP